MTTETTGRLEEIGRELARLAVDLTERGAPDYRKFLDAFGDAAPLVMEAGLLYQTEETQAQVTGEPRPLIDKEAGPLLQAYEAEVRRLLDEGGFRADGHDLGTSS